MLKSVALACLAAVAALAASPAAAQCLSIPDGTGGAVIHCQDGRIGQMRVDGGGGVAGMVGAQVFTGSAAQIAPGLSSAPAAPGPLNPDFAPHPVLVPPPRTSVQPPSAWGRRIVETPDPLYAGVPAFQNPPLSGVVDAKRTEEAVGR